MERIMNYTMEELVPVAGELVTKYTGKESTSVSYEKAKQLMEAVIYSIHEYEQMVTLAQNAVRREPADAKEAYQLGFLELQQKTSFTRELYNQLMSVFHGYGNHAYADTIKTGIFSFFVHYDARFRPQDHLLTLDYPILVPLEHLTGIDRIQCYLYCIYLEQLFLLQLPEEFIRYSLSEYSMDYEELFLNIPQVILRHLMCVILSGKHTMQSAFTEEELDFLEQKMRSSSKEELTAIMKKLLVDFLANNSREHPILSDASAENLSYHQSYVKLSIPELSGISGIRSKTEQELLVLYLGHILPDIAAELKNAAQHHNLANILPVFS